MFHIDGPPHPRINAADVIKALKADHEPENSSKIDLAWAVWLADDVHIPRKAEVFRDWLVEAWLHDNLSVLMF